jgi:hypothetical protein
VSSDDGKVHCRWLMRRPGRNDVVLKFTAGCSLHDLPLLYRDRTTEFEPLDAPTGDDATDGAEPVAA